MDFQVLVSTMNQDNNSDILEKMNIQSDAIVINQSNRFESRQLFSNGYLINFMTFEEKGVGLSRNSALMRATADICLFGDDDVIYKDNYREIVIKEFIKNPKADVMIFNLLSNHPTKKTAQVRKNKRLHFYNCFRYGAPQIAIRLNSIRKNNIYFSLLFGGGAKYSAGEDSLFLADCLKYRLRIYSSKETIGTISFDKSTWFNGYTDKYFIDKGILFYTLSKVIAKPLCFQFCLRHRKLFSEEKTWREAYKLMCKGIEVFKINR
ncbi:glycosyltransferase family A protein [Cytobacillus horneckiae]|uniref:glycosyltransferase family A protein n=1 Tax=Cytobacillus horneckiae TaxID=549687 RepID=UPI003D9A47F4